MTQFDTQYKEAIREIMNKGYEETNERTGHKIRIAPGITFRLNEGFPLLTLRKIPTKLFIAEMIWFISGSNKPADFVNKFTPIWKDFTEADGTVAAAYGYRWRKHFGRDQLGQLIMHLTQEPHSRQAVVVTWDPSDDGLYGQGLKSTPKKNVPCPYAFTVNIIGNKLHLHNIVRSNDMMLGSPHDVAGFALLQYILAAKLGVKPGMLTHSISNAHIYDIHYDQAWELLERENKHSEIIIDPQPDWFDRAEKTDESLVDEIFNLLNKQYHPLPVLEGMKIVL
ncbi:MAG: thymidylate synthase [Candidatus Doudnabacteria bacterium]|nr:thymidylate synthase [Candidatus Doudnabacteria bacterium]